MEHRTHITSEFSNGWQAEGSVLEPRPPAMKPIILTPGQRREIERRRKGTLDRRVYQRLTAVLTVAAGKSREEVADLLGIGLTQLGEWLRIFRNKGLDALCVLHYKGDPGKLTPHQIDQLKAKVSTGCFRNSDQIRHWIEETFHVAYKSSGVKDLLRRIGVSYHKVTGFLWKANPDKQKSSSRSTSSRRPLLRAKRQDTLGGISWMPAIRSGGSTWSIPVGCWWANVFWWGWVGAANG
jgi:transposase